MRKLLVFLFVILVGTVSVAAQENNSVGDSIDGTKQKIKPRSVSNLKPSFKVIISTDTRTLPQYGLGSNIGAALGYQTSPYLFLGAGLGVTAILFDTDGANVLLFGNVRFTPLSKRHTPFIDLSVGGNLIYTYYENDIFVASTMGYRFSVGSSLGIGVGGGYQLYFPAKHNDYYSNYDKITGGIHIKLSVDF